MPSLKKTFVAGSACVLSVPVILLAEPNVGDLMDGLLRELENSPDTGMILSLEFEDRDGMGT